MAQKDEINMQENKTFTANVSIKVEPFYEDTDNNPDDECGNMTEDPETSCQGIRPFENVLVKAEPPFYDSGEEINLPLSPPALPPTPVFLIKRGNKRKSKKNSDDEDEEYLPYKADHSKKKEKGELNYKPACKLKIMKREQTYSEDILKSIQIVQISEEERQVEHRETLKRRSRFKFVCTMCAVGFVLEDAYLAHMMIHLPISGDHECDVCNSRLKAAETLYTHRLRHFRRYRCMTCNSMFKDKDKCACHVMNVHARQAFVCADCGKAFKRPQYLRGHIYQHHTKEKSFECPICEKVFHERGRWRCHVRNHNDEIRPQVGVFACGLCGKKLRSKAYLTRHLATTHRDNSACDLCGAPFRNADMLSTHMRRAHGASKDDSGSHSCPHCPRVLTTRGMLSRHVKRMHMDRTKTIQCDYCKRFYYTKGEVRSHIMWSHMRARGGHACACGRVFRTPARLREHAARLHAHGPPPRAHECKHCGKRFGNRQVLTRHLKVHTDEVFPCNECGVTFKTQGYVKIHYKVKHLNMTRAQIKAESKRKKPITIEKGMILKNIAPSFVNRSNLNITVKEENMKIPTFETFVDVQK